jgi:Flp pilus assembly protein TadD
LTEFSEAVRIDPGSAQAQNNLGLALAQSGRLAEAAGHFGAAIRSEPDYQEARVNLEHTLRLLREGAAR